MLDATRIVRHLYQGSEPPTGYSVFLANFQVLVLCAEEIQPPDAAFPGVRVLRCPLDDNSRPITADNWNMVMSTAAQIAKRVADGQRVLVTCQMGINRSGLVSAAAVHMLTGRSGCSTARLVSKRRHIMHGGEAWHALSNERFRQELCSRLPSHAR